MSESTPLSLDTIRRLWRAGQPAVHLRHDTDTAQSINNATYTPITAWFNSDPLYFSNQWGMWDSVTNPERITVPLDGIYLIGWLLSFEANGTGLRRGKITAVGTPNFEIFETQIAALTGTTTQIGGTFIRHLRPGTYIYVTAYQDSGGALNSEGNNTKAQFFAIRIG